MIGNCRTTPCFSPMMIRLHRSWGWVRNDFADEFSRLHDAGAFLPDGTVSPVIWKTGSKFVLRAQTERGFSVAYKSFFRIRNFHQYLLRPSPSAAEAINYMRLKKVGLPLPDLLAVGELRKGFVLKNAFMVSRFAEGFRDGRDFTRDGIYENDISKRREFICGHLRLLAKLHDSGIRHRGFTPFNLLYREDPDGMKFCWIDVAECRRTIVSAKTIAADIAGFFDYMKLSAEERRESEKQYLDACRIRRIDLAKLFASVEKRLAAKVKK